MSDIFVSPPDYAHNRFKFGFCFKNNDRKLQLKFDPVAYSYAKHFFIKRTF